MKQSVEKSFDEKDRPYILNFCNMLMNDFLEINTISCKYDDIGTISMGKINDENTIDIPCIKTNICNIIPMNLKHEYYTFIFPKCMFYIKNINNKLDVFNVRQKCYVQYDKTKAQNLNDLGFFVIFGDMLYEDIDDKRQIIGQAELFNEDNGDDIDKDTNVVSKKDMSKVILDLCECAKKLNDKNMYFGELYETNMNIIKKYDKFIPMFDLVKVERCKITDKDECLIKMYAEIYKIACLIFGLAKRYDTYNIEYNEEMKEDMPHQYVNDTMIPSEIITQKIGNKLRTIAYDSDEASNVVTLIMALSLASYFLIKDKINITNESNEIIEMNKKEYITEFIKNSVNRCGSEDWSGVFEYDFEKEDFSNSKLVQCESFARQCENMKQKYGELNKDIKNTLMKDILKN